MKKFVKLYIKKFGINNYIAVKNQYNKSVNCSRFYFTVKDRLKYRTIEDLCCFFNSELLTHFKEYSQYQ